MTKDSYILYIWKNCYWSKSAIDFCKKRQLKHKVISIEQYGSIQEVVNQLKKAGYIDFNSKHKSVPIVFRNNVFIGGYTEFVNLFK